MSEIYLDHAATTAMHPKVLEAMMPYLTEKYYNPSTNYQAGRAIREVIENVRAEIAQRIHAKPEEIYYTSGGTEGDNWVLRSVGKPATHIITTNIEHHAILNTCKSLENEGCSFSYLQVDPHGRIVVNDLEHAVNERTALVSVQYANNEIGTVQPIAEIGKLCLDKGIYFHTDAVQAFGHIPIDVAEQNITCLSASAHKFQGPKGVGFLYAKETFPLVSMINGGGQERGMRAGTENVAGIVGMGKAVELACDSLKESMRNEQDLRDYMLRRILQEMPDTRINGHLLYRLPNNISLAFRYINGASLVILLDNEEIYVASGSACNSEKEGPSHVISALHIPEEYAQGVIRITIGTENTTEELEYVVQVLKRLVTELHVTEIKRQQE